MTHKNTKKCKNVARGIPKGHQNGAEMELRAHDFPTSATFENGALASVKHRLARKLAVPRRPKIDKKHGLENTLKKQHQQHVFYQKARKRDPKWRPKWDSEPMFFDFCDF